jgi:hypothetical protein
MHALCGGVDPLKEEVRLGRPSIAATLLWTFGIVIIGLTVYCMINWPSGWTENLHDVLLMLVSFSTGINAIATGALIDMHTLRYKTRKHEP